MRPKTALFSALVLTWLPPALTTASASAAVADGRAGAPAPIRDLAHEGSGHGRGAHAADHGHAVSAEKHGHGNEHGHDGHGDEHVHGDEHGDEHGVEHGHHAASETLKTTSFLLIGFLVANFLMLWLVNWPDPHVRSYTWKMISATVSIYLAVLINNSFSAFALYIITGKSKGSEEFAMIDFCLHLFIFLFCFAVGNVLCYLLRGKHHLLYATQVIGAHITAFAGIGVFNVLRKLVAQDLLMVLAACIIGFAVVLVRVVSFRIRGDGSKDVKALRFKFYKPGHNAHSEVEHWRHAVCEAEDDACSILASYVMKDVIMMIVFEKTKEELLQTHVAMDIVALAIAMLACIVVMIALIYARRGIDKKYESQSMNPISMYTRLWNSSYIMLSMTMSWLALYLFFWLTVDLFPSLAEQHHFLEIISAAILTGSAIVCIIVMDQFADKVDKMVETKPPEANEVTNNSKVEPKSAVDAGTEPDTPLVSTFSPMALVPDFPDFPEDMSKAWDELNVENARNALRTLIDSFGLAVGLAWEKAFHAALVTTVSTFTWTEKHEVISQALMALLSCMVMMPLWSHSIVPKAKMSVQQFLEHMEKDQNMFHDDAQSICADLWALVSRSESRS